MQNTVAKTKVLYIITTIGHGRGGHVFSLDHISKEMAKKADVRIISIGKAKDSILVDNPYFLKHVSFDGLSWINFHKEMTALTRDYKPDVIHCFDGMSYTLLTCLPLLIRYPFVVSKCGGENPVIYPRAHNIVVFSKENQTWFQLRPKFKDANIHLIPNRVSRLKLQEDKSLPKDTSCFTFVKINRINQKFKKDMLDSFELIRYLTKQHLPVKLIIIGCVEDEAAYEQLKLSIAQEQLPVSFVTDEKVTRKASDYLYLADAVIGTARSLMEAASLGLPVLTPASNYSYPVFVDSDNFEGFFATNFSPRNRVSQNDINQNLIKIKQLMTDKHYYKSQQEFALSVFDRYFNVENARDAYMKVYDIACAEGKKGKLLSDAMIKLRTIYAFRRYLWNVDRDSTRKKNPNLEYNDIVLNRQEAKNEK